ncbi:hypothetical protein TELCIR_15841, partial [Teladorsagia circumcincta]
FVPICLIIHYFTACHFFKGMTNHILTEKVGNVFWIRFNRPDKYNAITSKMYQALIHAFEEADNDDEVFITVLTDGLVTAARSRRISCGLIGLLDTQR